MTVRPATWRVVTWNIRHARRDDGVVDLEAVVSTLRSLDADLIAVQEVDRGVSRSGGLDQAAILADHLGMRLAFAPAIETGGGTYGHALLTRREPTQVTVAELPGRPGDERRVALHATVVAPSGEPVSVTALHLQPRRRHDRRAAVAVAQLRAALEHAGTRHHRRLLLGDLNLDPPAAAPVLRAAGLQLAATPPTHPRKRPRRGLDMVAVAGLTPVGVEVPAIGHSDHRPVAVHLELDADLELDPVPEGSTP
ncbi:MAG TPA: endonuclease/exonuclease/phosphatase family protein [Microthrixaceae bacterium]|nr:endonuclease/exonuclease/phosphatase family protein [Microthrixaceae bacterium]